MLNPLNSGNVLVTFSGESKKPIKDVYAITPLGEVTKNVLGKSFEELRGLAIDATEKHWHLYVVQAFKSKSRIYVYDRTPADTGLEITPAASAGLWHPYEVCLASGQVLVSNQDSNVVMAFEYPTKSGESARAKSTARYLTSHPEWSAQFSGTLVASAEPRPHLDISPDKVPAHDGGLHFDATKKHSVRGITTLAATVTTPETLFVADEPGDRVAMYDASDGTYRGSLTHSKNHSLQGPVGIALNPQDGCIYIGSTGNKRIFCYDPSRGTTELSDFIHDDKRLDKVSGIAFGTNGDLFVASRKTCQVYRATAQSADLSALTSMTFTDAPECLVVGP